MDLTLIGPGRPQLRRLRKDWVAVIDEAQLSDAEVERIVAEGAARRGVDLPLGARPDVPAAADSTFRSERKAANGSSIVVLAEHGDRSALLTGDGFAPVIEANLTRLARERDVARVTVSAVKLPHHGSRANTSRTMLGLIDSKRFLISSSGALYSHPDVEAIARTLVTNGPGVELNFNYRVPTTETWDDATLQAERAFAYTARYPAPRTAGRRVEL
jgi:hypothetical protein